MDKSNEQIIRLIVALQPRLRRFAYGLSGSMDAADELVQCTFERALQRLSQWQQGSRLDSWMYRILQTIWLNQLRAGRVRGEHLPTVEVEEQGCDRAQRQTEAGIMLERARRCIQLLPEDQRAPLLLISVEGFSYKEAAEVLAIPVGTLTSRLARGRIALLELMESPGVGAAQNAQLNEPLGIDLNKEQSRSGSGVAL